MLLGTRRRRRLLLAVLLTIINLVILHPTPSANADGGFGKIGTNIGDNTEGMSQGVKKVGFFLGIALVVMGIAGIATMKKTNVSPMIPILMCVCGVLLLSIFAFITAGSETIFGSDAATGISELELN